MLFIDLKSINYNVSQQWDVIPVLLFWIVFSYRVTLLANSLDPGAVLGVIVQR